MTSVKTGQFLRATLTQEVGWSHHILIPFLPWNISVLTENTMVPSSIPSLILFFHKRFLTVLTNLCTTKRTWPQVFLRMDFFIIKPYFISNFCASLCDSIHFQGMQSALGPVPCVFLICQHWITDAFMWVALIPVGTSPNNFRFSNPHHTDWSLDIEFLHEWLFSAPHQEDWQPYCLSWCSTVADCPQIRWPEASQFDLASVWSCLLFQDFPTAMIGFTGIQKCPWFYFPSDSVCQAALLT